ncbi:MAG: ATP-dependent Clp protease adapter ClpS [Desulfobacterales bacterium]|nr:MAG: ATP-dependent Clp protease adapter ClpS [Desulfobacterales bacterium]
MSQYDPNVEERVDSETDIEVDEPPMYKVMLLNDDYTTMDFVVEVLVYVFQKPPEEATLIMLNVHRKGVGVCGIYPYEIAETKVNTVENLARENGFPLKCIMERE